MQGMQNIQSGINYRRRSTEVKEADVYARDAWYGK